MVKKLLILNGVSSIRDKDELKLIKLKHPKSNDLVPFLFIENGNKFKLYQLISYSDENSSVFIDEYVQSQSSVYLAAPFHLNYLLIDFVSTLTSSNCKFKSIDEFKKTLLLHLCRDSLDDDHFDLVLEKMDLDEETLRKLFNLKGAAKNFEITFDKSKCINWLKEKVNKLKSMMDEQNAANKSENKKVTLNSDKEETKTKTDAFELICQYLSSDLCETLRKEIGLSSPLNSSSENKRPKQEVTTLD